MCAAVNEQVASALERLANQISSPGHLPISSRTLENVSQHDFKTFEYLLDPRDSLAGVFGEISAAGGEYLGGLVATGISPELLELTIDFLAKLETAVRTALEHGIAEKTSDINSFRTQWRISFALRTILGRLYKTEREVIPELIEFYLIDRHSLIWVSAYWRFRLDAEDIVRQALGLVSADYSGGVQEVSGFGPAPGDPVAEPPRFEWSWVGYLAEWRPFYDALEEGQVSPLLEYPFEVFPYPSINVGLAITYRQDWRQLGIQPGEIVKTIPLGPAQSTKVSTKVIRRQKTTRSVETQIETETTTETSDTTRDSNEIVSEASETKNWSLDVGASYGGFGFGASASFHLDKNRSNSSRETSSGLSETMKKSAERMKRQTKVSVTTETEFGFEETTSSEIRNPNDEIPVTYYYHSLQRQYDVHTYLDRVQSCIFVAERLPPPSEVDQDWVRRHDFIIARNLIDESFRGILNELIQDTDDDEINSQQFFQMANRARTSFATFSLEGQAGQGSGVSIPDIYAEPQRQYDERLRDNAARLRANRLRALRRKRLFDHIRQNILFYCRAIWLSEDNDQRLLRYKKENRMVPYVWTASVSGSEQVAVEDFVPAGPSVAVVDIIDPSGPIGVTGNYLVFALQEQSPEQLDSQMSAEVGADAVELSLLLPDVLDLLRAPFSRDGWLFDPALLNYEARTHELLASDPDFLATMSDKEMRTIVFRLPILAEGRIDANGDLLRDQAGRLENPLTLGEYAEYLLRVDASRRFLVESNNLFIGIHRGDGTALENFKQAHRLIDVLQANEDLRAAELKNKRRDLLKEAPGEYDPDVSKIVVVSDKVEGANLAGGLLDDRPVDE